MKLLVSISILLPLLILGQNKVKLDESFDPTSLNDWYESKADLEKIVSLGEHYLRIVDEQDSVFVEEYFDFVYRVQLGSTSDYDDAIALEQRANESFPEDVVIQFDSPYYKVRVGKKNNREDAQSLQDYAIQQGYRRAWVIRTENTPLNEN